MQGHIGERVGTVARAQGKAYFVESGYAAQKGDGFKILRGGKEAGGARFAISVGASVVPIALNSGRCWPRNSVAKHPGQITVSVGPVIATEGKTAHELNEEVRNWIEAEIERFESESGK